MEEQNHTANTKLNIRLTRHNSLNSHWRISPTKEVVVDTIDLCSSDDDEQQGESMRSPKRLGSDALTIIKLTHNNRKSSRRSIEPSKCPPETESVVDNSVKPLQQSLYIFSNFKANSVISRCTVNSIANHSLVSSLSTSNTFSDSQGHRKEYNQENCTFSKKLATLTDWYAHSANSEKSPITQTTESSTFEALPAVPPFNSTGRIISIDLTS